MYWMHPSIPPYIYCGENMWILSYIKKAQKDTYKNLKIQGFSYFAKSYRTIYCIHNGFCHKNVQILSLSTKGTFT